MLRFTLDKPTSSKDYCIRSLFLVLLFVASELFGNNNDGEFVVQDDETLF
jgi:hypothetical protein